MTINPFVNRRLASWLLRSVKAARIGLEDVSLLGEQPLQVGHLSQLLNRSGLAILRPDTYTEVLVLGREGWRQSDLHRLLRKRSGRTLRVYSQEMFLMYLVSGNDPLLQPRIAVRLGRGHPGLELLRSMGFEWPTIEVKGFGRSHDVSSAWRSEGFLKAIGYRVGVLVGDQPRERHRQLVRAYGARVPRRFGSDYIGYWGVPRSSLRLERMAYSIARFYRMTHARQHGDFREACEQWKRDLRWLKRRYYRDHPRFNWPSILVG